MKYEPDAMLNRMIGGVIKKAVERQEQGKVDLLGAIIHHLRYADLPDQVILDKLTELEKGGVFLVKIEMI